MLDRDDWKALNEQKRKESFNGHRFNLEFLAQAEVHQKNLTGHPEWDRFLSYLSAFSQKMQAERMVLKERLCDPQVVSTDTIMAMKMSIVRYDSIIEAVEAVMALPKAIIEMGDKAKNVLSDLEKS